MFSGTIHACQGMWGFMASEIGSTWKSNMHIICTKNDDDNDNMYVYLIIFAPHSNSDHQDHYSFRLGDPIDCHFEEHPNEKKMCATVQPGSQDHQSLPVIWGT